MASDAGSGPLRTLCSLGQRRRGGLRETRMATCSLVLLAACGPDAETVYEVTVHRTEHGVAHFVAEDMGSLGYGAGYASAQDHGCTIAEQLLKVRSERAKYWGRGEDDVHVNSDFAYLHLGVYESARQGFDALPEDLRATLRGYAAGYNDYLHEVGPLAFAPGCEDSPADPSAWILEIDAIDLYAYYRDLALLASGRELLGFIATAQPPGQAQLPGPGLEVLEARMRSPFGSNGWALGSELSARGGGMLLANPHFPWQGELRLWEAQYTIPGELDVYGASLLGVPIVLIGFNRHVAWTHTVSAGQRFTFYKLELEPGEPTSYRKDGETLAMSSERYEIEVLGADGQKHKESRTLWRSEYGPILNVSPFGWQPDFAITYRDANIDNVAMIPQFMAMNRARSMDAFQAAHREHLGIPWVNTMASSADGRAWYIDSTPTPRLSDEAIAAWQARLEEGEFFTTAFGTLNTVLLEGNGSRDDWTIAEGARDPGLVPWSELPQLERRDFIFNANDSHWMSNPAELLEGYSPLHGPEATARSVRTRMNARILTEGYGGFAGADARFSLEELRDAALSNRSMTAELLRDELIAECEGAAPVEIEGVTVPLAAACEVLAAWDGRFDLDSAGAPLFREFVADFDPGLFDERGVVFAEGFRAEDPIGTPSGLTGGPRTHEALARAMLRLEEAGFPLDATLGELQHTLKGSERVPIHGGNRSEGITNLIVYSGGLNSSPQPLLERGELVHARSGLSDRGYVVNYGTSFIMTLGYRAEGPEAYALLTYGQSEDPDSPHFSDQTRAFSAKQWRKIRFSAEEIAADPELETVELKGRR